MDLVEDLMLVYLERTIISVEILVVLKQFGAILLINPRDGNFVNLSNLKPLNLDLKDVLVQNAPVIEENNLRP